MAPAVRLSTKTDPTDPRITLLGTGDFGLRVAEIIQSSAAGIRVVDPGQLEEAFALGDGPVVLVLWRPSPALCDRADDLAFRHGRPWLPVVQEHPRVRIGPLVRPPYGVCFACYQERRFQHDTDARAAAALHDAYDRDPSSGPPGYLPHHARMTAALTCRALDRARGPGTGTSYPAVVTIDVLTATVRTNAVLDGDWCVRQESHTRTSDVARALAALPPRMGAGRVPV